MRSIKIRERRFAEVARGVSHRKSLPLYIRRERLIISFGEEMKTFSIF
jgi:hypothetical protein